MILLVIVSAIVTLMSVVTFFLYLSDKRRAERNDWRISEKALLLCSCFGGAIGGLVAMYLFRHKTQHWYFKVLNVLFVIVYLALILFLGIRALG